MRRPPRHSAVPNLSSLRVTRLLSLSWSAAFGTFRHVPKETSGPATSRIATNGVSILAILAGCGVAFTAEVPGQRHATPVGWRPRCDRWPRDLGEALRGHTPTTPRPHPDLAPTSPGCWRCGRGSAAYALPMLGARTSCPAWCASRAVRAPGVKWTAFARIEDGQGLRTAVSMSTSPVRISDDPERTQIAGLLAMRAVRWCARAGAGAHLGDVPG